MFKNSIVGEVKLWFRAMFHLLFCKTESSRRSDENDERIIHIEQCGDSRFIVEIKKRITVKDVLYTLSHYGKFFNGKGIAIYRRGFFKNEYLEIVKKFNSNRYRENKCRDLWKCGVILKLYRGFNNNEFLKKVGLPVNSNIRRTIYLD